MASPLIYRLPDLEAVSLKAAEVFTELSETFIRQNGRFVVALSGGSTPGRLYGLLASEDYRGKIDWKRVEFFWGDERSVPPESSESNYKMAHDALLNAVPSKVHRIRGEIDPAEAAIQYEKEIIGSLGTMDVPPAFDLVMLGVGEDGHTASLFPGSRVLGETERLVMPVYDREVPRVTLTLPVINNASNVMFLVSGKSKAGVVAEILERGNKGKYPAGLVRAANVIWLTGLDGDNISPTK